MLLGKYGRLNNYAYPTTGRRTLTSSCFIVRRALPAGFSQMYRIRPGGSPVPVAYLDTDIRLISPQLVFPSLQRSLIAPTDQGPAVIYMVSCDKVDPVNR